MTRWDSYVQTLECENSVLRSKLSQIKAAVRELLRLVDDGKDINESIEILKQLQK